MIFMTRQVSNLEYILSATTDIGISRKTNQDSFGVKLVDTKLGKIAFAVLCDGVGGLSSGEVASATMVDAFHKWVLNRLPLLCESDITDCIIENEWTNIILDCNEKIRSYGKNTSTSLGTTLTVLMITDTRYFIINIGDSRVYEVTDRAIPLTKDQTVVAKEVEKGILTEEQARTDPRKNILLQCVGASEIILPDMYFGDTKEEAVYMLCSDGFCNRITSEEIQIFLNPSVMYETMQMKQNMDTLIDFSKQRMEHDNMTAVSIRTYSSTSEQENLELHSDKKFSVIEEFSFTSSNEIVLNF